MRFIDELKKKQELVNEYIKNVMKVEGAPSNIIESMRYSVFAGGKRIRPVLGLAIGEALGGEEEKILPFACAVELIHTYSLIHDDLPAMDNDDLRRGKPTNHRVFGEAMAILSGDGLLNYAFETMFSAIENLNYEARFIKAAKVISEASGVKGMIGGQVIDMESEGKKVNPELLYEMHSKKTGALIDAACIIGGIIADREDKIDEIRLYSNNLGIAFQIVDDILDYVGDEQKLGKKVGSDEKRGKSTYVSIFGLDIARDLAKEYSQKAMNAAARVDNSGFLPELTEYLLNREY